MLIELGARLQAARHDPCRRHAEISRPLCRLHRQSSAQPGVGLLAGWRGADGERHRHRRGQSASSSKRYIENGCFWRTSCRRSSAYFKHANAAYLKWPSGWASSTSAEPIVLQLYSETLQKFRLAARGHGAIQPPGAASCAHRQPISIRCRSGIAPFERERPPTRGLPLHAITQRPMAMYHSWGSQNAWLRQIHGAQSAVHQPATARELGIADGDWVWVDQPPTAASRCQVKLMDGVNPDTVWTWNAIGKRSGAWNLAPDAPRSDARLPAQPSHPRTAAAAGRRLSLCQRRSGDRSGRVVRPARAHRKGRRRARAQRAAIRNARRAAGLTARPEILRYGARFRRTAGRR